MYYTARRNRISVDVVTGPFSQVDELKQHNDEMPPAAAVANLNCLHGLL